MRIPFIVVLFIIVTGACVAAFANAIGIDPRPELGTIKCRDAQIKYASLHPFRIESTDIYSMGAHSDTDRAVHEVLEVAASLNKLCK